MDIKGKRKVELQMVKVNDRVAEWKNLFSDAQCTRALMTPVLEETLVKTTWYFKNDKLCTIILFHVRI